MALKKRMSVTYVTDRGYELAVDEMTPSHLMNAIIHHRNQIQALGECPGQLRTANIDDRIKLLNDTVYELYRELSNRNPNDDQENGDGD